MKIKIEINDKKGITLINSDNFDSAIIDLINEREWDNYWEKDKIKKNLQKIRGKK